MSTFFEDVNEVPPPMDEDEIKENYQKAQRKNYCEHMVQKYKSLRDGSCDSKGREKYAKKVKEWREELKEIDKPPILPIEKDENGVIINAEGVLLNRIERGDLTLELNPEKQAPHMKETKKAGSGYFDISFDELQKIIYDKHGTGIVYIKEEKNRVKQIKETIELDRIVAHDVDDESKSTNLTDSIAIHYSKKRTHAVPSENSSTAKRKKG